MEKMEAVQMRIDKKEVVSTEGDIEAGRAYFDAVNGSYEFATSIHDVLALRAK